MRLIDADKYMNYLRAEINSEADIIAKRIKEDDPIGTVKDCGRIGRLQGLQWNRNMLELDSFTVEAVPKAEYEARLKADMLFMLYKLRSEIINMPKYFPYADHTRMFIDGDVVVGFIDNKIDTLRENEDGKIDRC